MNKKQITIAMFCSLVVVMFVFLANISSNSALAQKAQKATKPPGIELISPRAGDVLVAGQPVRIEWRVVNGDKGANLNWCEQEVLLSMDGGRNVTTRISPQLDPRATSFDWVVTNTPTKEGVLDIRIGCEGGYPYPETARLQGSVIFQIVSAPNKIETVTLASLEGAVVNPGDEVSVNWESSVEKVKYFEVMVSYDSGAHYNRIGKTNEQSFSFNVTNDFAGSLTFQIVARKADGTRVQSLVDLRDRVLVKNPE